MSDLKRVQISLPLWNSVIELLDAEALGQELFRFGLNNVGTREELLERLRNHLTDQSAAVHFSSSTIGAESSKLQLKFKLEKPILQKLANDDNFNTRSVKTSFCGHNWWIYCSTRLSDDEEKRYLAAYLQCDRILEDGSFVSFQTKCHANNRTCTAEYKTDLTQGWGSLNIMTITQLKELESLNFTSDITFYSKEVLNSSSTIATSDSKLFELHKLLQNKDGDVQITLKDDSQIKAHRMVLTSQSPVFEAMFQHNLLESLENTIHINDFEPEQVKSFVEILYSGFVRKDADFASLFMLADKYNVDILAKHCLKQLLRSRTVQNCVDLMVDLKRFNYLDDEKEKENLASFILENYDEIREQEAFGKLSADPELLLLILDRRGRKRKFDEI